MVSPERWRQIEAAYDHVIELPTEQRGPALERICGSDAALREELEAMLAGSDAAPEHLREVIEAEAVGLAGDRGSPMIGRRIGPYRLTGELGHGGMGAVYRAERDDEYHTVVAIKLLERGFETRHAIARFRDERQILATLEHPGIVRLLDGGTTDGLPYLVMEYVQGTPITTFVRERDPPLRSRVELLQSVCAAVQSAHQRLIVHRDIKPSNILVTDNGVTKLLDFGIAKLLANDEGRTPRARTSTYAFTPEYASPEQARGEAVTVASDVYSLGAVLYEVLVDRPLHQSVIRGRSALQMITETMPARPSVVGPVSRRRALAGDLDNIVLKALAKEPKDRYATVDQLAEDLRRYLDGQPVTARAGTWAYRAGKFIRRNRVLVTASSLVAIALAAATAISVDQAHRANDAAAEAIEQTDRAKRRFDDVRRLANTLLFDVDDHIKDLAGSTAARELIVGHALAYLDRLAAEAPGNPELAGELASAYVRVGDIQGNARTPNLGRQRDALRSYQKARQLIAPSFARGDEAARWVYARLEVSTGDAYQTIGDRERAVEHLQFGVRLVDSMPAGKNYDHRIALLGYAGLFELAPDAATARRYAGRMVEAADRWIRVAPSLDARYWTGVALEARGAVALLAADPDSALPDLDAAVAIFRRLSIDAPATAAYERETGSTLIRSAVALSGAGNGLAWSPGLDDRRAAEAVLLEAEQHLARLAERDRNDSRGIADHASVLTSLGVNVMSDDAAGALRWFERARSTYATTHQQTFNSFSFDEWYLRCAIAEAYAHAGDAAAARTAITVALAELATMSDPLRIATCKYQLAGAHAALGDRGASAALLDQVVSYLRDRVAAHPVDAAARVGLATTLDRLVALRPAQRCALAQEARALWETWPAPTAYTRRQISARAAVSCGR